jgi:hypothetical protein
MFRPLGCHHLVTCSELHVWCPQWNGLFDLGLSSSTMQLIYTEWCKAAVQYEVVAVIICSIKCKLFFFQIPRFLSGYRVALLWSSKVGLGVGGFWPRDCGSTNSWSVVQTCTARVFFVSLKTRCWHGMLKRIVFVLRKLTITVIKVTSTWKHRNLETVANLGWGWGGIFVLRSKWSPQQPF